MAINSFREDEEMSQTDKGKIIKRLLSHLLHYKLQIVTVLACMLITVVISLVNPLLIETALDKHVANGNIPALLKLAAFAAIINTFKSDEKSSFHNRPHKYNCLSLKQPQPSTITANVSKNRCLNKFILSKVFSMNSVSAICFLPK